MQPASKSEAAHANYANPTDQLPIVETHVIGIIKCVLMLRGSQNKKALKDSKQTINCPNCTKVDC